MAEVGAVVSPVRLLPVSVCGGPAMAQALGLAVAQVVLRLVLLLPLQGPVLVLVLVLVLVCVRGTTVVRPSAGTSTDSGTGTGTRRDALEGGEVTPTPLHSAQPMRSHCLPDGKCQLQWHF